MTKRKKREQPKFDSLPIDTNSNQIADKVFTPKMIWPLWEDCSVNGYGEYKEIDSDEFPGIESVKSNHLIYKSACKQEKYEADGYSLGIREFWEEFATSTQILFADTHFRPINYHRMILELDKLKNAISVVVNKEIYICVRDVKSIESCQGKLCKKYPQVYSNSKIFIGRLPTGVLEVHDRFAIMDTEIWHCGATIGGMHPALNAITRGFKDNNDELRKFFIAQGGFIGEN